MAYPEGIKRKYGLQTPGRILKRISDLSTYVQNLAKSLRAVRTYESTDVAESQIRLIVVVVLDGKCDFMKYDYKNFGQEIWAAYKTYNI